MKSKTNLPNATAERIPMYYRYLNMLAASQVQRIKSQELSKLIHIPSATIRRDFSCFGELGRSGYGYDVQFLKETFAKVLNVNKLEKIALIGVGNLGQALIRNNFRRNPNLKITIAFEQNETLIDTIFNGVPIYSMALLRQKIQENEITTAISTVPSAHAGKIMPLLDEAGIRSVLNFAPERLKTPQHMMIRYIDLTSELQTLIYLSDREAENQVLSGVDQS
ncbi:redox-sensing transcriptional repressor Rex [Agrilactobacillus fermenti]|uniref:redox-sensing transcriptional repressor Rex n=1 Tax=Agrilactobacillus fermenti TaxID=2586909 RepID=UPI001E59BBAE|nr:redox-sensing transcriptional repressor Rex [Agrilactobacillus fermenti]MCD2256477.1 redox-sensing transcriptional repressor Rex [Agrilactobacillus fermenti]